MDAGGEFVARLIDTGLRAHAAAAVLREREELRHMGVELGPDAFEDMARDAETRLLHAAEALAAGAPELFLQNVEWTRSTYAARGLPDERVALHLGCLRAELDEELPPAARERVRALFDRADGLFEHEPHPIATDIEGPGPHVELRRRLLLAILEARRDDALDLLLRAADDGASTEEIELDVLVPVQQEVGRMWQSGEVHVHEEHLGSQIVEEALVLLGHRARNGPGDRTVLVSAVAGNLHDLGARVVANRFEADGWNVVRLGASLPGEDLVRAALDFRADLIALSVTLALHVRSSAAVIRRLRAELGRDAPPILVGGAPFVTAPDLWRAVGADGTAADVRSAPAEGRRLVGKAS